MRFRTLVNVFLQRKKVLVQASQSFCWDLRDVFVFPFHCQCPILSSTSKAFWETLVIIHSHLIQQIVIWSTGIIVWWGIPASIKPWTPYGWTRPLILLSPTITLTWLGPSGNQPGYHYKKFSAWGIVETGQIRHRRAILLSILNEQKDDLIAFITYSHDINIPVSCIFQGTTKKKKSSKKIRCRPTGTNN